MRAVFIVALLACITSGLAHAEGWRGFYVAQRPPVLPQEPARSAAGPGTVCLQEILAAQDRHAIPGNLLLAIGLQEAGTRHEGRMTVWPYAVNAAGEGRLFDSEDAAKDWVRSRQAAGVRSIDVGCMQINLRWHPDAFASLDEGFDPRRNVDYAARFLKRLQSELGDWMTAAGAYHSREPFYRNAYLDRLEGNIVRANDKAEELGTLVMTSATPLQASNGRNPRISAGVGWGGALGGGGRTTLYSSETIHPLIVTARQ